MTRDILATVPFRNPFLTEGRSRLLAKTFMDLVKIVVAAALASGFFARFAWPVRLGAIVATALFFIVALIAQPADTGARKE